MKIDSSKLWCNTTLEQTQTIHQIINLNYPARAPRVRSWIDVPAYWVDDCTYVDETVSCYQTWILHQWIGLHNA